MSKSLNIPIENIKGIGTVKAEVLKKECSIFSLKDLLQYYPNKYIDRSKIYRSNEIDINTNFIQLQGKITALKEEGIGLKRRLKATFTDKHGEIELVWFKGAQWIKKGIKTNTDCILFGSPNMFNNSYSISHPEINYDISKVKNNMGLHANYPLTERMKKHKIDAKFFRKIYNIIFLDKSLTIEDSLPPTIVEKMNFISPLLAFKQIHIPKSFLETTQAMERIKFEECFRLQIRLFAKKNDRKFKYKGLEMGKPGKLFNTFFKKHLSFELTNAQKRVIKEIYTDLRQNTQMNRLLQGDVGSGKTIVSVLVSLIAIDNGFQVCLMAPTEILAQQHYAGIREILEPLGVQVRFLSGSTKKAARVPIFEELKNGKTSLIIGTHALLEPTVQFNNLGLAIIDEQHRFGVAQRARLWAKNTIPPHILVMTATPIPRTLAMSLYGDLDVSIIDEMPKGRKPIITAHRSFNQRINVMEFVRLEINKGRQAYFVYPLIEESEKLDFKNLMDGYDTVSDYFPTPQFKIALVHGKMKPHEKEMEMERFRSGKAHILIATTVIEVGVDVPNASVMIIESAERFGLSQIHQLRGRVGRGSEQSYCILLTKKGIGINAKKRMNALVEHTDGFKISEIDLMLRGPGEFEGTRQSGNIELKLTDLVKDVDLLQKARDTVKSIFETDPQLTKDEHLCIINFLKQSKIGWGAIS